MVVLIHVTFVQASALPVDGNGGAGFDIQGWRAGASVLRTRTVSNSIQDGEEGGRGGFVEKRAGIGNVLVGA